MFWQPVSPLNADQLNYQGSYDPKLVLLSVAIAIFTAYMAFLMASSALSLPGRWSRKIALALSGTVMGLGIWAMHFIGMLGFELPCPISYDPLITFISVIPAIAASIYALNFLSFQAPTAKNLMVGAIWFGLGIGTMHYSGMAALELHGNIYYELPLFVLSLVIAVMLAFVALLFRFHSAKIFHTTHGPALGSSALVMGLSTSGMHYTAMTATHFICRPWGEFFYPRY